MSIVIENSVRTHDRFKAKCPTCGVEVSYSRCDVKPHRRWPKGYIYCPNCKCPIGHDESNLFEKGEEVLARKKAKQQTTIKEAQDKRDAYLKNTELVKKDVGRLLKSKKIICFLCIPLDVVWFALSVLFLVLYFVEENEINRGYYSEFGVLFLVLAAFGLAGIIIGYITIDTKIYNRRSALKK